MSRARRGDRAPRLTAAPALLLVLATSLAGAADQNVTAHFQTDRSRFYEKEPIELTLVIEAAGVQLGQSMQLNRGPEGDTLEWDAFKELPEQRSMRGRTILIQRRFRCTVSARRPGPVHLAASLRVALQFRSNSFFGAFLEERPLDVDVLPLDLQVLPIPVDGRPANWSGAIGRFALEVTAAPTEVGVNDLVTLRMAVIGKGYTNGMAPPRAAPDPGFRMYDPVAQPAGDTRREFHQVVMPLSTNAVAAPAVSFCYFDTLTRRFETPTRGPFPLVFRKHKTEAINVFRPAAANGGPAPGRGVPPWRQVTRQRAEQALPAVLAALAVAAAAGAVRAARRRRWRRAAFTALLVVAALAGAAVVPRLNLLRPEPGACVTRDVGARLAPSERAVTNFAIKAGTAVSIHEEAGADWVRVRAGGDSGWIPSDSVSPAP
jgi:hypothetical protein